ncbi:aminopeptidase [Pelotomaculum propionicicum]|uniref:M18 family aminopeptidase n=1 Tax=Pelotomaculum propionicicum TaxID=258475 RepID=A0A4Y7RXJ7_9FIRM|nr:aminopeptidase [Pelotomaculum propionicicum]NLI14524.1 aminopeptidase [Peptococcaceae bacterium]TEB13694.1 putative M18 family aminopeptidase 1 [Pelotomaculum propionicicum]
MADTKQQHPALSLAYRRQNAWDRLRQDEKNFIAAFCEEYKDFLNKAKTEREAVAAAQAYLAASGFHPLEKISMLKPGDRVYSINRGKALTAAVIGDNPAAGGLNIIGAHLDSPRLDLKPQPLYEDEGMALFKTHYYGGIKKYQWLSVPLALHGVVVKADGRVIPVVIGEKPGEPVFTVSDLLPHLAKDQMDKKLAEAVPGESLNVLVGGIPAGDEDLKDRFKLAVLEKLNHWYGIAEEDLISAEIELVPAWPARDVGLDGSFVGGYGQDDRVCSYVALRALAGIKTPRRTALLVLADKEETGSNGNTGMESAFFTNSIAEITARCMPGYSELALRRVLANSRALSADVNVGLDPNFGEVVEKMNAARLGGGVVLTKYTGSRGKYSTSDAHAEVVADVRRIFNNAGVLWQTGELGKVDQGGGGTIAHLMAAHGMDVIDCGVALLGMHSTFEIASKADIYMTYKGYKAFLLD